MLVLTRPHIFVVVLTAVILCAAPTRAQEQQRSAASRLAPIPPAISSAKKIFISNAGADAGLFPHPFSGAQDRMYNQFYAAMQKWGHYELVAAPDDADLVFELRLSGPIGPANPDKVKGASDPLPIFYLTIVERKSHYTLWTLTESIGLANLQKTHDRNFDNALDALVVDLQSLI
jgi:hypothetical protein